MLLTHVQHKMPIYRDCTLGEMLSVGAAIFASLIIVFCPLFKVLTGYAWIGLVLTFLLLLPLTRLALSRLQTLKVGKPHGYYGQLIRQRLQAFPLFNQLFNIGYCQRRGRWTLRARDHA